MAKIFKNLLKVRNINFIRERIKTPLIGDKLLKKFHKDDNALKKSITNNKVSYGLNEFCRRIYKKYLNLRKRNLNYKISKSPSERNVSKTRRKYRQHRTAKRNLPINTKSEVMAQNYKRTERHKQQIQHSELNISDETEIINEGDKKDACLVRANKNNASMNEHGINKCNDLLKELPTKLQVPAVQTQRAECDKDNPNCNSFDEEMIFKIEIEENQVSSQYDKIDNNKKPKPNNFLQYNLLRRSNMNKIELNSLNSNYKTTIQSELLEANDDNTETPNKCDGANSLRWNKRSIQKYVKVIQAYNPYTYNIKELTEFFKLSSDQIKDILKNEFAILKTYNLYQQENSYKTSADRTNKKVLNKTATNTVQNKYELSNGTILNLSLDDCIKVIRLFVNESYTHFKISCIFNCSTADVKLCLLHRNSIIQEYKKLHPDFDESDLIEYGCFDTCIKVIKYFENQQNSVTNADTIYYLTRWFNCSQDKINKIIQNRESIKEQYREVNEKNAHNQSEMPDNLNVSNSNNALSKATQLKTSADFKNNNSSVTKLMTHLEDHLKGKTNSLAKRNNIKISSYNDALSALKPVGDYAKLTNNASAINSMAILGRHLLEPKAALLKLERLHKKRSATKS